jgi:hypothetical protein
VHGKCGQKELVVHKDEAALARANVLVFIVYRNFVYVPTRDALLVEFYLCGLAVDLVPETGTQLVVNAMQAFQRATNHVFPSSVVFPLTTTSTVFTI